MHHLKSKRRHVRLNGSAEAAFSKEQSIVDTVSRWLFQASPLKENAAKSLT
jgi:hypothetical protein